MPEPLLNFLSNGLLDWPLWKIVLITLVMTHITIAAVTIYLHRSQAHRALDLHPALALFFRFWLWMTTGMQTNEWVAVHRKHHARCEREGDPHSPTVFGIRKVFWEGAELYKAEAANAETLAKFAHGTPNDVIERKVFGKYVWQGCGLMLIIDLALFGVLGLTVWAVQMLWIPVLAAGVVNGIGHFTGYRNFDSPDASRNILPWGILIGGEELHNNHHAYATSAKLSSRWYEFDIGWLYIRLLSMVGLAKIRKVADKPRLASKAECDQDTLQAVLAHRYEVMAHYSRLVRQACRAEAMRLKSVRGGNWRALRELRHALSLHSADSVNLESPAVRQALTTSGLLATLLEMRAELAKLWERSSDTTEQLVVRLQGWCNRAQQSGIHQLEEFAQRLRSYAT